MLDSMELRRAPKSWTAGARLGSGLPQCHPESLLRTQTDMGPLLDFLADDDRPTFILEELERTPHIVFSNDAFKRFQGWHYGSQAFDEWLRDLSGDFLAVDSGNEFGGKSWFCKDLRRTWKIVQSRHTSSEEQGLSLKRSFSASSQPSTWGDIVEGGRKLIDWTRDSDESPNPWIRFVKNYNWGATDLGPMQEWPEELRRLTVLIMACPDPRMIYWNNNQSIIYNEAAAILIGSRHPSILGQRFVDVWGEQVYQSHMGMVKAAIFEGRSEQRNGFEAVVERNGSTQETFWDIHLLPVPGPNGHIIAAVNEYTESTSAVIHEQRRRSLARISEHTALAETLHDLWQTFLADLEQSPDDACYVMVYTAQSGSQSEYHIEGSVGVNTESLVPFVDITETSAEPSIANAFHHARDAQQVVKLTTSDGLPQNLALPIEGRGIVQTACVLPITSMNGQQLAFIVMGLNPRRPFTEETGLFVNHLRDLMLKFSAIISLPEEQRRDQAKFKQLNLALTQQLRITALKVEKNEETFMRMARNAPFGMYMYSPSGEPKFVNDSYLEVLSMTRAVFNEKAATGLAWRDTIYHEDIEFIGETWARLTTAKTPTKLEYRVLTKPKAPGEAPGWKWVENISFPELDEEGNVITILGWLYDISHRKLTEALMAQRLEDALENKRASERFIDMTSHEMRNPLSAILQLADEISTSMPPPQSPWVCVAAETIETILDAAQTILLCAQHQKNIVDDVLTISKLDSNLLVITPDKVDPVELIRKALKMYEAELSRADITGTMEVQQSYADMNLDQVMLDPSRLLQVIINLLTNAIKFTKDEPNRHISVILSASRFPPTGEDYGLTFAPPRQKTAVATKSTLAEWGGGEEVYIQFAVTDTGKGLTTDEMKLLFHRFSQGNPRTYKQYGGSGLGLFISKELSELQGGQIGVHSLAGQGSTFTFFVKARRCPDSMVNLLPTPSAEVERRLSLRPDEISSAPKARPKMSPNGVEPSSEELHVLVVEDNAINQRVMAQQLRRLGCTVMTADHGLDALNRLKTTTFYQSSANVPLSIVLMDLEMPVMDGLTCIAQIRQLERAGEITRHIPVIAITANARSEQINTALEAGMDQVVTKPFTVRDLMPKMQALIAQMSH